MLGVGIFGLFGHQIHQTLRKHPRARVVAAAGCEPAELKYPPEELHDVRHYASLEELLKDDRVRLVSLCSPVRAEQANQAIACLEAGKDVYAEKPCAMSEVELDRILAAAQRTGRAFHEMAGTTFAQPFMAMRKVIQEGTIGQIVQVFAQKSYPYHDRRPDDERIDGGLIRQAAVHATRMIEHVSGIPIEHVQAIETTYGDPKNSGLRMAAAMTLRLANGAVGALTANYLNPKATGVWGYEELRFFGTQGLVESVEGHQRTRLLVGDQDRGPLDTSQPVLSFLDHYLNHLLDGAPMPLSPEEELHPTRIVLRAKVSADPPARA